MRISIGSDHAGFELKKKLIGRIESLGHVALDRGTFVSASVDYPDFAALVAEDVAKGEADGGVLICGTGIGMAMKANKVQGIRAAVVYDMDTARLSKEHNDANVICIGARTPSAEIAPEMLEAWLSAEFQEGRHRRRVCKIEEPLTPKGGWEGFPNVHVIEHPLIQHKLCLMRQKDTEPRHFRELVSEMPN